MDKDQARAEVQRLIDKFNKLSSFDRKNYNEANTRKNFIMPLFRALGWDVYDDYNKDEVIEEETTISGRMDYSFKLNSNTKFILEAKSISEDLDKEQWAHQAVEYGWNKGIPWVVLTDFEGLKVFNSEWDVPHPRPNLDLKHEDYITRFEDLWLLSKESFLTDELDKQAQKWGITAKRESVDKYLSNDLIKWREILTKNFYAWNKDKQKIEIIEAAVQKILDRLVFIRVVEDKGLEEKLLWQTYQEWEKNDNIPQNFIEKLIPLFRRFDKDYDSNLFTRDPCEQLYTTQDPFREIIPSFYENKKAGVKYRFDAITSTTDIFGEVYQQYLGYIQGREGDKSKRKKGGIYYTPAWVVDYVVKETLKPVLDRCTSIHDLKKIKVLDPACGSGSFLIKVLDVFYAKYKEFNAADGSFTKLNILLDNIYGVDLDNQAVEIAKLNLLINACDKKMILPNLEKNIRNGNSLISGEGEELKKYFGKNYRDKKPFNWSEEFPEVFKQGGFDVIVGNPPWGANVDTESEYFTHKYPLSTKSYKDTYKMFIDIGTQILHSSGLLGFVVPNTFLYQPRYQDIKEYINPYKYIVTNLGERIFGNVQLPCCTLILTKVTSSDHKTIDLTKIPRDKIVFAVQTGEFVNQTGAEASVWKDTGFTIDDVLVIKDGGVKHQRTNVGKGEKGKSDLRDRIYYTGNLKDPNDHALLIGSDIDRYKIHNKPSFILKNDFKVILNENEIVYFDRSLMVEKNKLLWRQTADQIRAVLVGDYWFANTLQCGTLRPKYRSTISLEYCLAILNSNYLRYLYQQKVLEAGKVFPQVKLQYLKPLPFPIGTSLQIKSITNLVTEMLHLNSEENKMERNSEKWSSIKSEIEKTDKKIDDEVYKLYGLTQKEIEIIEKN